MGRLTDSDITPIGGPIGGSPFPPSGGLTEEDRNNLFEAVYLLDHVESPIFHAVARMVVALIGEVNG